MDIVRAVLPRAGSPVLSRPGGAREARMLRASHAAFAAATSALAFFGKKSAREVLAMYHSMYSA